MERVIRDLRDRQAQEKLVGQAPAFLRAIQHLPAIAKGGGTVLINGETGTGKELVARAIHYLSERNSFPFVPVNCGSLPEALLEDELFGHERGAFTDAYILRPGLIAEAEHGTWFLDEVGTLTARGQVALLRVLQDKEYRPIGSNCAKQANVRVIAATNAPLDAMVRDRVFRADLYYRLCVFSINLPPLRKRKEDILTLAAHFLQKHAPAGREMAWLKPSAIAALIDCDWPGNVRELENSIIRALHLSETEAIEGTDLGLGMTIAPNPEAASHAGFDRMSFKATKRGVIEAFELDYLTRLISEHRGNLSRAARAAGKERRDLSKLLKKYHLDPKVFQISAPHPPVG